MDSARFQSNTNLHRTPGESTKQCVWKPGGQDKFNGKAKRDDFGNGSANEVWKAEREESACGSKEFDAPIPWATSIRNGSSPSRVRG